jgi:hypothetical protein
MYLLADRVSDEQSINIGANVIKTLDAKIFFEDYFDESDSLNIAGMITTDYTCVVSGLNWYKEGNIYSYADSLFKIQSFRKHAIEYSEKIYEVAGDTIYYFQREQNFISAVMLIPSRNLYVQVIYYEIQKENIQKLINEMIYYDHENPVWKELESDDASSDDFELYYFND